MGACLRETPFAAIQLCLSTTKILLFHSKPIYNKILASQNTPQQIQQTQYLVKYKCKRKHYSVSVAAAKAKKECWLCMKCRAKLLTTGSCRQCSIFSTSQAGLVTYKFHWSEVYFYSSLMSGLVLRHLPEL